MHPQTHYRSGRHVHHQVLDWRSLRGQFDLMTDQDYKEDHYEEVTSSPNAGHGGQRRLEAGAQDGGRELHTRQLDFLSSQLGSLKQNMMEKQSCLAHIIDVQKKMIRDQSFMIMDLNEKMKETGNESHDSKNASRSFPKTTTMKAPVNNNNEYNNNSKATKKFSDLYLKAVETKDDDKDDDYESVIDDDDNDSFITIESDAESDVTLGHEDQSSSDSGYTDIAEAPAPASSYGVNPMFGRHSQAGPGQGDGTESCEDFVFFNSGKDASKTEFTKQDEKFKDIGRSKERYGSLGRKKGGKTPLAEWSGSLKRSHRIVIINNEQALVCNESCLI